MQPRVIKTRSDYEEALAAVEHLIATNPETNSDAADELELLAVLVEKYERENFPIDVPTPVEAIEFRMDQAGLTRRDLEPFVGSKGRVSEILNGKRQLTLRMVRTLHAGLDIPLDALVQEHAGERRGGRGDRRNRRSTPRSDCG
jgi:HTH-type transcriptional regulator/antitoxin HigA